MTYRYVTGVHAALVGPDIVILTSAANLSALDELEGWSASIARVLGVFGRGGLGAVPPFACVVMSDGQARMAVAGDFAVEIEGASTTTIYDGSEVTTWTEKLLGEVSDSLITVRGPVESSEPGPLSGRELTIADGVVLASRVLVGTRPEILSAEVDAATDASDSAVTEFKEDEKSSGVDLPLTAGVETGEAVVVEDDVKLAGDVEPSSSSSSTNDPEETQVEGGDSRFDAMFGKTVTGRRPEDAAVREVEADTPLASLGDAPTDDPPQPEKDVLARGEAGDHDGHTMAAAELAAIRAERAQSSPRAEAASPIFRGRLELSSGESIPLDRTVFLGRAPQARNTSQNDLPTLVVLDNPYVSGTHIEIALDGGDVLATDVSTNGSIVTRPGSDPVSLEKGVPTALAHDTVITLADELTIRLVLEEPRV